MDLFNNEKGISTMVQPARVIPRTAVRLARKSDG
jgi:hypothetical protein